MHNRVVTGLKSQLQNWLHKIVPKRLTGPDADVRRGEGRGAELLWSQMLKLYEKSFRRPLERLLVSLKEMLPTVRWRWRPRQGSAQAAFSQQCSNMKGKLIPRNWKDNSNFQEKNRAESILVVEHWTCSLPLQKHRVCPSSLLMLCGFGEARWPFPLGCQASCMLASRLHLKE